MVNIQKIASNIPISKIRGKFKSPVSVEKICSKDSFKSTRSIAQILNTKLKETHGINSSVQDVNLLGKIYSAVQEFCALNGNEKLFNGLEIKTGKTPSFVSSERTADEIQNKFCITFNQNISGKQYASIAQGDYDFASAASCDPLYQIYLALGDYLNFAGNPKLYKANYNSAFTDELGQYCAYSLSDRNNCGEFNAHYIASKMCGINLPEPLDCAFMQTGGNGGLKFKESVKPNFIYGKSPKFSSKEEASLYLKKYGVEADFMDLRQAQDCVGAIEDLIEAADGNERIFDGLKISYSKSFHTDNQCAASTTYEYDHIKDAFERLEIIINANADNWKDYDAVAEGLYKEGIHPTDKIKGTFIHELAHVLDIKGNPRNCSIQGQEIIAQRQGMNQFTRGARVSRYATDSPMEFSAEYISGKMAGIKYPTAVDHYFERIWNGVKLNFPKEQ